MWRGKPVSVADPCCTCALPHYLMDSDLRCKGRYSKCHLDTPAAHYLDKISLCKLAIVCIIKITRNISLDLAKISSLIVHFIQSPSSQLLLLACRFLMSHQGEVALQSKASSFILITCRGRHEHVKVRRLRHDGEVACQICARVSFYRPLFFFSTAIEYKDLID